MDPHAKFGSDVWTEDAAHKGYEKVITYIMRAFGKSRAGFPNWSENACEGKERRLAWGFHCH